MIQFSGLTLPLNIIVLVIALIYMIIMLCTLYNALKRIDLEPISKFMWVFVITSVPLFGIIFYVLLAFPHDEKNEITTSMVKRWENKK